MVATTEQAAKALSNGELVIFPTETVFGLGADARNGATVAEIFAAKGRPQFNPLIAHIRDLEMGEEIAEFNDLARRLAAAFWPGPMSLVLPLCGDAGISELVTAGLSTIALRVPNHPTAQELLSAFNGPIAAPSANISGKLSPTRAGDLSVDVRMRVAMVLEGEVSSVGLESTILMPEEDRIFLLRSGAMTSEMVRELTDITPEPLSSEDKPKSPGQLLKHYAPNTPLVLDCEEWPPEAVHIGFGDREGDFNLSQTADLTEAAANLFAMLHAADRLAIEATKSKITVAPVPAYGLGVAINDRLKRASS